MSPPGGKMEEARGGLWGVRFRRFGLFCCYLWLRWLQFVCIPPVVIYLAFSSVFWTV